VDVWWVNIASIKLANLLALAKLSYQIVVQKLATGYPLK
jgi:hypothetical protein